MFSSNSGHSDNPLPCPLLATSPSFYHVHASFWGCRMVPMVTHGEYVEKEPRPELEGPGVIPGSMKLSKSLSLFEIPISHFLIVKPFLLTLLHCCVNVPLQHFLVTWSLPPSICLNSFPDINSFDACPNK